MTKALLASPCAFVRRVPERGSCVDRVESGSAKHWAKPSLLRELGLDLLFQNAQPKGNVRMAYAIGCCQQVNDTRHHRELIQRNDQAFRARPSATKIAQGRVRVSVSLSKLRVVQIGSQCHRLSGELR